MKKDSSYLVGYVYVCAYQRVTNSKLKMKSVEEEVLTDLEVSRVLIDWYESHKRALPWRETADPYLIWVSEIILQQTRVAQGLDYFLRFTERFPSVRALAEADEGEVLKYWQGLGYYSRARNLHAAAKRIVEHFGGQFPRSYDEVLSLKGVGAYTAAAIVSFAWGDPYPVVDGNVYRVLARLFGMDTPIDSTEGKKQFTELAGRLLDPRRAGSHNQAIMELGALQCVPRNPDCSACPLADRCVAYAEGRVEALPVKSHKTKTRDRYFHYLYLIYNREIWLRRRPAGDIWEGLYEFPLIETEGPMDLAALTQTPTFRRWLANAGALRFFRPLTDVKHILSHQVLHASFYGIEPERAPEGLEEYVRIPLADFGRYAIPRLIHIYMEKMGGNLSE